MPPASELTEAQRAAVERISAGPRGKIIGPFVPMLRSPELMTRVQLVGEFLRFESALDDHLLEVAILAVARHWNQQFEWGFHAPLAAAAGISSAVIDAIDGDLFLPDAPDDVATVVQVTTQLLTSGKLDDSLYDSALAELGETKLVELVVTIGYYTTLALVMNTAQTPPPAQAPRLSARSEAAL